MQPENRNRIHKLTGALIALIFCAAGFYTISDYGLTWDFVHHLPRGEAYLNFFLTGNTDYTNIAPEYRCKFQTTPFTEYVKPNLTFGGHEGMHPSMAGLLSAIGCEIFYKRTHLLDQTDAHHAMLIILSALAVWVVYLLALEAFNFPVAVLSALFLCLTPRFVGDVHNNYKDIPVLCFLVFTVWAFWKGIKFKSWKWVALAGFFWGLSLAVKMSGYYMPVVLLVWLWAVRAGDKTDFSFKQNKALWIALALFPVIALLTVFLTWPYLWYDLGLLTSKLAKIGRSYSAPKGKPSEMAWRPYYPPGYAFITTPVAGLILGALGFFYFLRYRNSGVNKPYLLTGIWFLGAILSLSVVKAPLANGVRDFLNFIPPFCILSGIGGHHLTVYIREKARTYTDKPAIGSLSWLLAAGAAFSMLVAVVQTHPFQTTFFNATVGGLKGAQQLKIPFAGGINGLPGARDYWGNLYAASPRTGIPDAVDYWGNSYRTAVKWLNRNLEQDALLSVSYGEFIVRAEGKLRPDIKLVDFDTAMRQTGKPVYKMFIPQEWVAVWNKSIQYCFSNLKPCYMLKSQGAPVVLVYKIK